MLFADADASNANVLITQIVVGGVLTLAASYFAMRAKGTELAMNMKTAMLEQKATDCEEDRKELKADRNRMADQIDALAGRVKAVEKAPPVRPYVSPPGSGPHPPLTDEPGDHAPKG